MSTIRAQVIIPRFTNKPEDVVTNTWHFSPVGGLTGDIADEIVTKLAVFYNAIDQYMSPVLSSGVVVKLFDLSDAPPRQPYDPPWGFNLTPSAGTTGLPEEVACCLSLHAALPHTPRRRGRIYIGPMAQGSLTFGSAAQSAEWATAFRAAITSAAEALLQDVVAAPWSIYSQTDGVARNVTGGWLDLAPDTQRRRQMDARTRLLWGAPN